MSSAGLNQVRRYLKPWSRKFLSPNVAPRFFGAVETSSELFITSEFTDGSSLWDLVNSPAELPFSRRLEIALDAARGLAYLHSRSPPVLHSDVKGCARRGGRP